MSGAEKKDGQTRSHSPDDSVDLGELLAANQLRSPGWIDAVNRVAALPLRNPAVNNNSNSNNNNNYTAMTSTVGGSSPGEHTPSTSRYPADITAIGSPIPVDTDDSDAHINQLISRLGSRGDAASGKHPTRATAAAAAGSRGAPVLLPQEGPTPQPAQAAPRATAPPSPRPIAGARAPTPTARVTSAIPVMAASTRSQLTSSGGRRDGPHSGRASTSSHPRDSLNGVQHFPFGDSRNASTHGEHALSGAAVAASSLMLRHSELPDRTATTTATDTFPQPTSYSSALMQALSRSEGAAAVSSQWTSTLHPSRTYSDRYDDDRDDDDDDRSADYPPDIYEEAMRAKVAKQQWMALERARQEVLEEARRRRDCPFAPQVSPYAAQMRRPASLRPENRVQSELIRRKQWLAKKQQQEVERELKDCTFRPLTVRAAQLDPAALAPAGPAVFHHLYAEAQDRRTFETEVKPQLVEQIEGRPQPSTMRPEQLAEVVERLCARGVVRADEAEGTGAGPSSSASPAGPVVPSNAAHTGEHPQPHQPILSEVTQRIVAAQVAAGERDPDVVRHLYRQAERDALKDRLKVELDAEKERVARAEQAMQLEQDRRRLQQEYYRAVLAAKYRALSRHGCDAQRVSYRATAPQSVALLARAAFDLLSTDETEELLSALEHCGQHKLREAEFVTVVFQHCAAQRVAPTDSALLTRPPPAAAVVGPGAANAKRASSAPRSGFGSLDSSPLALPKIKREKADPEMIAQIRENRALALEEWKKEHQRRRAIAEGVVTDEDYPFQPAPRRLIPYECRPDVSVPVKLTRSEALRRAYIAARHPDTATVASAPLNTTASSVSTGGAEQATTARELFTRLATAERRSSVPRAASSGAPTRSRSRSSPTGATAPAAAMRGGNQREGSAAGRENGGGDGGGGGGKSEASHAFRPWSRPSSASTRGPSTSSPQPSKPAPTPREPASIVAANRASSSSYRASLPAAASPRGPLSSSPPTQQQQQQQQQRVLSPAPAAASTAAAQLQDEVKASQRTRSNAAVPSSSLVDQIMQSTPEERARLGKELLLRQLRDRQRSRAI